VFGVVEKEDDKSLTVGRVQAWLVFLLGVLVRLYCINHSELRLGSTLLGFSGPQDLRELSLSLLIV